MTLTNEEVNALMEVLMKLTESTVENAAKINALEEAIRKRPEYRNLYQAELDALANSSATANMRQALSRALSEMQHEFVRPKPH